MCIVSRFNSEPVFKGLSTDFVKLDRFIQKLKAEQHTGFIEVFTKQNEAAGTIFFKDGEPANLSIPSQSAYASLPGPTAVPAFLEEVIKQGAIFDVYRSFSEIPVTDAGSTSDHRNRAETSQQVEIEGPTSAVEEDTLVQDGPERNNGSARNESLSALQEIFGKTERFVDGFSQEGSFLRAFKRALIEKSDIYPFLDPFADQFEYGDGKIALDEAIDLEQFAAGIAECFNLTLSHLKKEFPKQMGLSPRLRAEMESTFGRYENIMKNAGIQSVPPLFFK
jgi:hypothetical protein